MSKNADAVRNKPPTDPVLMMIGTDIVAVLLSATLLSLPIEDGRFWPVAFVALVPMLLRMWTRSYRAVFFLAFSTFWLYLFYSLQWVNAYGRHWTFLLAFMNAVGYGLAFLIGFYILRRYRSHFFATVPAGILVLLEYQQSIGFTALPWPLLCHSQSQNLPLIQIAAVTGCWGVTFLIVHVNEALAHLIAGSFKAKILPLAILPVILVGAAGLYGALSLARSLPKADIQATLVQWNEPTNVQWGESFRMRSIEAYSKLTVDKLTSERASAQSEDTQRLVIWPETAVPDAAINPPTMSTILQLARAFDATFLVGCLTFSPADGKPLDLNKAFSWGNDPKEYNSLVAFNPDNTVIPVYSKIHLVPFGEVIPMKKYVTSWFPAYPWGDSDITQGSGFYVAETPVGKIGAVICYESFIPQIPRNLVRNGAEILVLVSNTSWFGETNASYQHARFDAYRAVENGIWFCRAATTGVSSVIDPQGRTIEQTEIFVSDAITVPVGKRVGMTLYTRWGDWVPALCGIYVLLLLLGVFLIREEGNTSAAEHSSS